MPESDWKAGDPDWRNKGIFKKFHQYEFLDTLIWEHHGLDQYGYVYYPDQCYDGSRNCKVHMYIHGCGETVDSPWMNWKEVIFYGGWLEYAASNDLILLMPQVQGDWLNPYECFDIINMNTWWSELNYISKNSVHLGAFKRMIDRVTEPRSDSYNYGARSIQNLDENGIFWFDAWRSWLAWPGQIEILAWYYVWGGTFWVMSLFFA